jgi:hypothetical protein
MMDYKLRKDFVNEILSPDPKGTGEQPYPYIQYNDNVYELKADAYKSDPSTAIYEMLEDYPTSQYKPIYNANKSLNQLADEYKNVQPEEKPEEPNVNTENSSDIAHNTSNTDPVLDNVDNAIASSDDGDSDYTIDPNDIINNTTPAGEFDDEDTLENHLCNVD